ncbi:MAG: carbonic anhydrase family protein [Pseudomonadota bacterium]
MRPIVAILCCACLLDSAHASDPVPAAHGSASASIQPALPEKTVIKDAVKDLPKPPSLSAAAASLAATRAKEDAAAADELAVKIATRMAALRARNAAKAAQAAKAARLAPITEHVSSAVHGAPSKISMSTVAIASKTSSASLAHAAHWSYEGEGGPTGWGKINPSWSKCDTGNRQSPIDIRDGIRVDLEQIAFDYRPTGFNVIDNGHTVQVNIGAGNTISVMGRTYELVQFHFHRPAEERINGKGFEMVAHLVHKDLDGRLAVVAVLIERGKPHTAIQSVWNNLPLEKNDALVASSALDLNQILPARRDYYTYMGSMTTPPCSENVLWMVMKEPIQASFEQIAIFSKLYPMNARPIQSASGRMIKQSN